MRFLDHNKKEYFCFPHQYQFSVDIITGIAEYKATVSEFTKATPHSFPLPVLKDPDLISNFNKLNTLSKSLLFISIGLDIADSPN